MHKKIFCFTILLCLFGFISGCNSVEDLEQELGVSYSEIVCEYYGGPNYGMIEEMFPTHITVYGDNTVTVWTGPFTESGLEMEVIYSETYEITEEQKQALIHAIREKKIIKLGDIGYPDSCDGGDYYIRLFDANGEKVYSCGGMNPDNERFDEVRDMILDLVSKEERKRIHEESCKITREAIEKDENISTR